MSELSILTKKKIVTLQLEGSEDKQEVILYPFAWKHFNDALQLVNKYWSCYQKTKDDFRGKFDNIIETTKEDKDSSRRKLLIELLNKDFNEIGSLVKNILESNQAELASDIEKIIGFCLKEKVEFSLLNFGEVASLLTAAIEVNMDFFEQNLKNSTLFKQEKNKQEEAKDGELKSAA